MNLGILGVLPWREVIESQARGERPHARGLGPGAAAARDRDDHVDGGGLDVRGGARLQPDPVRRGPRRATSSGPSPATHPSGDFPHRSLLLVSGLAWSPAWRDLETVIAALLTSRIPIQFVGQIATVFYSAFTARAAAAGVPDAALSRCRPLVALAGWLYVFGTSTPACHDLRPGIGRRWGWSVFVIWDRVTAAA